MVRTRAQSTASSVELAEETPLKASTRSQQPAQDKSLPEPPSTAKKIKGTVSKLPASTPKRSEEPSASKKRRPSDAEESENKRSRRGSLNSTGAEGTSALTRILEEEDRDKRSMKVHRCRFVDWVPESIQVMASSSENDGTFAVARKSGQIEIWRANSSILERIATYPVCLKSQGVRSLCFVAGRLFGGTLSGHLFELDLRKGTAAMSESFGGAVWSMAGRKIDDELLVAAACEDGRIRVFRASPSGQGLEFASLVASGGATFRWLSLTWSTDQDIFIGGMDGIIRKLNYKTNRIVETLRVPRLGNKQGPTVWALSHHAGTGTLVSGDSEGRVVIWDAETCVSLYSFSEHRADVLALAFNAEGDAIYASGVDSRVAEFKKREGAEQQWVYTFSHRPHTHDTLSLCVVGETLLSGGVDSQLCWYSTQDFDRVRPKKSSPFGKDVAARLSRPLGESGNDLIALVASTTTTLDLWHMRLGDAQHTHLLKIAYDDDASLRCFAISGTSTYVASSDDVRGLRLFRVHLGNSVIRGASGAYGNEEEDVRVTSLRLPSKLTGFDAAERPSALAFVDDLKLLVATTLGRVFVFQLDTMSVIRIFEGDNTAVKRMTVSMDRQFLAVLDTTNRIRVFSLDALVLSATFAASLFAGADVACLAFSPENAALLYVVTNNARLAVLDVETSLLSSEIVLPQCAQNERPVDLTFNPATNSVAYVWCSSYVLRVSLKASQGGSVTTRRFKTATHVEFVGPDELVVIEAPWINALKHLPDILDRPRYGAN